jgi:hypothetical protein
VVTFAYSSLEVILVFVMTIKTTSSLGVWLLPNLFLGALLLAAAPTQAQGFGPMAVYATGANRGPVDLKVADVNGDGFLDIVTAETEAGVGVLLGLAGGIFAPAATYAVGPRTGANTGATRVVLGDVTGCFSGNSGWEKRYRVY